MPHRHTGVAPTARAARAPRSSAPTPHPPPDTTTTGPGGSPSRGARLPRLGGASNSGRHNPRTSRTSACAPAIASTSERASA